MGEVTKLLRARHNIGEDKPDDFTVTTQAAPGACEGRHAPRCRARRSSATSGDSKRSPSSSSGRRSIGATRTMTALLAGIAAVSLLVGGIGIMNVMLLSVTEAHREIGIRRAVGRARADVRSQFVIEAVALSLAGGIAGVVAGLVAAEGLSR
jgi:putative ABC transport system permease protein